MKQPQEIVDLMIQKDPFSSWLGIQIHELDLGACTLKMTLTPSMLNGFEIAHGGISYSLADSALAFASNSYGAKCLSIETSISHLRKVLLGDTLFAKTTEVYRGRTTALYTVTITNQENSPVAYFKGTVQISSIFW